MVQRILFTGATGFLGRHCIEVLQRDTSWTYRTFGRTQLDLTSAPWLQPERHEAHIVGDIADYPRWGGHPMLEVDFDAVLHIAAEVKHSRRNIESMMRTNVQGTQALAKFSVARGIPFYFLSSSGVVGNFVSPDTWADEDSPYAKRVMKWPYYRSKVEAEKLLLNCQRENNLDVTIFRPPVLLGPGDHRLRSTRNIIKALTGKLPLMVSGGMHYCDIRDVASSIIVALRAKKKNRIYHFPGRAQEVESFFQDVCAIGGVAPSWRLVNTKAATFAANVDAVFSRVFNKDHLLVQDPVVVEMATSYWGLKTRHSDEELHYTPRPWDETLRDTINDLQRCGAIQIQ